MTRYLGQIVNAFLDEDYHPLTQQHSHQQAVFWRILDSVLIARGWYHLWNWMEVPTVMKLIVVLLCLDLAPPKVALVCPSWQGRHAICHCQRWWFFGLACTHFSSLFHSFVVTWAPLISWLEPSKLSPLMLLKAAQQSAPCPQQWGPSLALACWGCSQIDVGHPSAVNCTEWQHDTTSGKTRPKWPFPAGLWWG